MDKRYSELKREIIIDNFSEYIQTTSKIRPIPFIEGKSKIPKKYLNDDYEFRNILFYGKNLSALVRKSDGTVIPTNSKTVSKPRIKKVNGQDVYNQNAMRFSRAKIVNILHEYFDKYTNIEPITDATGPLFIEMLFYVHDMGRNNIDNDNKWIWRKCFQDTIVNKGIIPDDNVYNISRNAEETILISEEDTQRLIIRIYE